MPTEQSDANGAVGSATWLRVEIAYCLRPAQLQVSRPVCSRQAGPSGSRQAGPTKKKPETKIYANAESCFGCVLKRTKRVSKQVLAAAAAAAAARAVGRPAVGPAGGGRRRGRLEAGSRSRFLQNTDRAFSPPHQSQSHDDWDASRRLGIVRTPHASAPHSTPHAASHALGPGQPGPWPGPGMRAPTRSGAPPGGSSGERPPRPGSTRFQAALLPAHRCSTSLGSR